MRAFNIEQFVLPAPTADLRVGLAVALADPRQCLADLHDHRGRVRASPWSFGLLAGIVIGSSTLVYDGFYPALVGFNSIPKVAVIRVICDDRPWRLRF